MIKIIKNIPIFLLMLLLSHSVLATETIRVGMSGQYFPFTFVKRGELQGFEVDLWNEVGYRIGYQVEFHTSNFSGLFGLLDSGRIDTISNQITITEARKAKYLFSEAYTVDGPQVVTLKNSSINGLADLEGKTVAVNLGSNFEALLRKYDTDNRIHIKTYDTGIEQELRLGRIDAFIMDRSSALALIRQHNLPFQLAGEPFDVLENAWPISKSKKGEKLKAVFNQALREMRVDGTLSTLSKKWFSTDITR